MSTVSHHRIAGERRLLAACITEKDLIRVQAEVEAASSVIKALTTKIVVHHWHAARTPAILRRGELIDRAQLGVTAYTTCTDHRATSISHVHYFEVDKHGSGFCITCRMTAWSPFWVADGVFSEGTDAYIAKSWASAEGALSTASTNA